MKCKINWDISGGVFAVPDAVAEEHLKLASGKAVKVLLYLLKYKHTPDDPQDIGVTAEDVEDAVSYWKNVGVICESENDGSPSESRRAREDIKILSAPPSPPRREAAVKPPKALLPEEIAERINGSEEIRFMFKSAEESLKRILTFDDQRTILMLYDHYGMSADIVTMLIASCCGIGRGSMAYIEDTAHSWYEKNVTTHEQAENEILLMQKAHSFEGRVQSRLKLLPKITKAQRKYIEQWAEWDVSLDLVELAYDKTVDGIGKLSFGYMNKILSKWHDGGAVTAEQAEDIDRQTRPAGRNTSRSQRESRVGEREQGGSASPSFDLSLILEHAKNSTPTL